MGKKIPSEVNFYKEQRECERAVNTPQGLNMNRSVCFSVIQSQSREDPERMDALVLLIIAAARADSTADAVFLVHERHPEP